MEKEFLSIKDLELEGKTVLLRVDFNSPINPQTGEILDDTRIRAHIPTIKYLRHTKLVILAHQGRPGSKDYAPLSEHAERLESLLGQPVKYVDDLIGSRAMKEIKKSGPGDILLLENTRFYAEEVSLKKPEQHPKSIMINRLSAIADLYANDAFAAAHRAQPSLVGFVDFLPCAAGLLMEKELMALRQALEPVQEGEEAVAVLGGMKVDDSIRVMRSLLRNRVVTKVLTSGVVGNVVLLAMGKDIGKPNVEFLEREIPDYQSLVEETKKVLEEYPKAVEAPRDVAVNVDGMRKEVRVDEFPPDNLIFDIGIETISHYALIIRKAKKVILNGPAGVFEIPEFSYGTYEIFRAVAHAPGYTVIGGGHTSAVAEKLGIENMVSHISTGGGSLIEFLSGKELPVVSMLKKSKHLYMEGKYKNPPPLKK